MHVLSFQCENATQPQQSCDTGTGKEERLIDWRRNLATAAIKNAATSGKDKMRQAKVQSMIRASASAASAVLGNLAVAKQLAMSALTMEDACLSSHENSLARRALLCSVLHYEAAFTLLSSARKLIIEVD